MQLNPEIKEILKEFKIDTDEGTLFLLAVYFNLDAEKVCSEDTIKAINLTKIIEKKYIGNSTKQDTLTWNVPLFLGQETEWDWVINGFNAMWNINPTRKDGNSDVVKRMQEWFKKHPQYRKQDVQRATQAYFTSVKDPQYLKSSAKFIFEGAGGSKTSQLLAWCEKTVGKSETNQMRGTLLK